MKIYASCFIHPNCCQDDLDWQTIIVVAESKEIAFEKMKLAHPEYVTAGHKTADDIEEYEIVNGLVFSV